MKADLVRKEMNRCGIAGTPFLFGVDFEKSNGFFVENPLKNASIPFVIGQTSNVRIPATPIPVPELKILRTDAEAYQKKFDTVHKGLLHGDSFLLNLTERTPILTNLTLEQIFWHSQAKYKLLLPGQCVCFSPESFVQIKNGEIFSYPMKGTLDATIPQAEQLLLDNYKEKCEHDTIVDLIRNDLNQIAVHVKVNRFRYMERVRTIHGEILQTSSEICGTLPQNWNHILGDLIFHLLPADSISGAPKPATIRLIQEAEQIHRGYYTGVFGYFDGNNLDSGVLIRYIEKAGDCYFFRSGGGITVNSCAAEEYQEVLKKIYLPI